MEFLRIKFSFSFSFKKTSFFKQNLTALRQWGQGVGLFISINVEVKKPCSLIRYN